MTTDTLSIANSLKAVNFTEDQASTIAQVVRQASEFDRDEIATKEFVRNELRNELQSLRVEMYRAFLIHGVAMVAAILAASQLL